MSRVAAQLRQLASGMTPFPCGGTSQMWAQVMRLLLWGRAPLVQLGYEFV
jgi:hypothetical protein